MKFLFFLFLSLSVFGQSWSDKNLRGRTAPDPFKAVPVYENHIFNLGVTAIFPFPTQEEKLLVSEIQGRVWLMSENGGPQLVWKYDGGVGKDSLWNSGITLYSVAVDPEYPKKPYMYINYHSSEEKVSRVVRYTLTGKDTVTADMASKLVVFQWDTRGHCGCELRFGPKDGYLYLSTGDAGDPGDKMEIGQKVDNVLGSVLRIDVKNSSKEEPYKIPDDNPFVGMEGVRPEVWSYGLRNPFRMSFDPLSGQPFIGDNGDQSWEYAFLSHKGANHGWSVFEGSHPFKTHLKIGGPTKEITHPVIERSHIDTRSIMGGYVYQLKKFPELHNHYIFGDYVTGLVWAAAWDGKKAGQHKKLLQLEDRVLCFGYDFKGNILIGSKAGKLYKLVKNEVKKEQLPFPETLSATGLFKSTKTHEVAEGVFSYKINAPAWRDGATVERFVALPEGKQLFLKWNKKWEIPDGAVLFQTLSLPLAGRLQRIETQMIYREGLLYDFKTFKWREDQSDADLVGESGLFKEYETANGEKINWQFQGRSQCFTCHSAIEPSFTLGFSSSQLMVDKQIQNWFNKGIAKGNMKKWLEGVEPLVNPHDESKKLESRARSYLHVNCTHCHQEGGVGGRAAFRLNYEFALLETKLLEEKAMVPIFSGEGGLLISPGNPHKSELYRRISIRGGGQMPLVGSAVVDSKGSELIRKWIENLGKQNE